jgi:hypothetical protein
MTSRTTRLLLGAALLAGAGALDAGHAPAQACDLVGTWRGPVTFTGRMASNGTKTMTIAVRADCSYQFDVPGVVSTAGRASKGWGAGYSYRNEAGSIGDMTVDGAGPQRVLSVVQSQGNYTAKLRPAR